MHLYIRTLTTRVKTLFIGHGLMFVVFVITLIQNEFSGSEIAKFEDLFVIFASPSHLKVVFYCFAYSVSIVFAFNIKVYANNFLAFSTIHEKVEEYYQDNEKKRAL